MTFEMFLSGETFITYSTQIRPLSNVDTNMTHQTAALGEIFTANCTLIRPIRTMDVKMTFGFGESHLAESFTICCML